MNVCFLLTHVPNPRMNKRIEVFKGIMETQVICTRRASQDIWEPSQDIEHIIFDVDLPSAKHIIRRYIVSRDFQKKALKKIEELKPNIIYAEGLDTLIIAKKYRRHNKVDIFFEVADLRENYIVKPKKLIGRLITDALLRIEKNVFGIVDHLIVTSPKFYDIHYHNLIPKDRVLFIPNAPEEEVFKDYKKKDNGPFTVGFIGAIRYLKQMKILVDAANEVGVDVVFAGAGGTSSEYEEIREYCEGMTNVTFTGRYNYDSEIAGIYGKVDCVFSVYDADNPNVCIALPNKLYESIICECPIIVARGTYLSELVDEWKVGISVGHKSREDVVEAFKRLKEDAEYYNSFVKQCHVMKKKFMDNQWKLELIKQVK